jgi:hypothetical protein
MRETEFNIMAILPEKSLCHPALSRKALSDEAF